MTPNPNYAGIELRHIQLELQNGRCQHLRHFADQYYCYKHGYVKKRSGAADWEQISWVGIVSEAARKAYPDRKTVVKEHVVPLKVVGKILLDQFKSGASTLNAIAGLLDKYLVFGTITHDEDRELRRLKLTSSMPEGFFTKGHQYYGDVLSRYRCAQIPLEDYVLRDAARSP